MQGVGDGLQKQAGRRADADDRLPQVEFGVQVRMVMVQAVVEEPGPDAIVTFRVRSTRRRQPLAGEERHDRVQGHLADPAPDLPADLGRLAPAVVGEHLQRHGRGLGVPASVGALDVHQVGRRQPGLADDLLAQQLLRLHLADVQHLEMLEDLGHRLRAVAQQGDERLLARRLQEAGRRFAQQIPVLQPVRRRLRPLPPRQRLQPLAHLRMIGGQMRQRQHALRPDRDLPIAGEGDVAVAAQGDGEQVGGLHAGLVLADRRALDAHRDLSILDQRQIGGRAADVDHQRVVQPGEEAAADGAGRRAGVDRLDRRARGELVAHQRAVPAHHHQRRVDPPALHGPPHGDDEILQDSQQRGVQRGRGRPFHRTQLGRKLVAQHDRQVADARDGVVDPVLVLRVERAEVAGNRERVGVAFESC